MFHGSISPPHAEIVSREKESIITCKVWRVTFTRGHKLPWKDSNLQLAGAEGMSWETRAQLKRLLGDKTARIERPAEKFHLCDDGPTKWNVFFFLLFFHRLDSRVCLELEWIDLAFVRQPDCQFGLHGACVSFSFFSSANTDTASWFYS